MDVVMPQEVHGLTFSATPQQNINILTLGAADGKGGFFPNGVNGPPVYLCSDPVH
jgi:hypothetical protein